MNKKLTIYETQIKAAERMPAVMNTAIIPKSEYDMYFAMALAGEVGEALNMIKKIKRGSKYKTKKFYKDLGHELADIQMYLVMLAQEYGINLADAVVDKFNLVSDKYNCPIKIEEK